ncbi:hypothetical protein Tco_1221883, partial [Tanacetum coccineum]
MADPIISISFDTSEESVGLAPKARVTVVSSLAGVLDLITYSSNNFDSSEDPSAPEHASSALTTSLFLHSSDSSETSRDSAVSGSLERPPPLDSHKATVARKRVHPVPARISANRRRFHSSSSSSSPCKRRKTSSCLSSSEGSSPDSSTSLSKRSSHSVTTHSPSPSTRLSRKRCRPPTNLVTSTTSIPRALVHVRADLLLPRKRIKGSSAALSPEDTIEESLEVGSEEDIDSDVMADIKAYIATKAAAANEIRDETKIGVNRVFEPEIPVDSLVPASGGGSREDFEIGLNVEIRALTDEKEMAHMRDMINVIEGSNMRLRGALAEERERTDSVWRRM